MVRFVNDESQENSPAAKIHLKQAKAKIHLIFSLPIWEQKFCLEETVFTICADGVP